MEIRVRKAASAGGRRRRSSEVNGAGDLESDGGYDEGVGEERGSF